MTDTSDVLKAASDCRAVVIYFLRYKKSKVSETFLYNFSKSQEKSITYVLSLSKVILEISI